MDADSHSILSGWKDIAQHLGKGVRTAQRYERELGLPVRRPSGHDFSSVVAMRSELDAWVSAAPMRATFRSMLRTPSASPTLLEDLAKNVEKMGRLRDEMLALRIDVIGSLDKLRANIRVTNRWRDGGDDYLIGSIEPLRTSINRIER